MKVSILLLACFASTVRGLSVAVLARTEYANTAISKAADTDPTEDEGDSVEDREAFDQEYERVREADTPFKSLETSVVPVSLPDHTGVTVTITQPDSTTFDAEGDEEEATEQPDILSLREERQAGWDPDFLPGGNIISIDEGVFSLVGPFVGGSTSDMPSDAPSSMPSDAPSSMPSDMPSSMPSDAPSSMPSDMPSDAPSDMPSDMPSSMPSDVPSSSPSDSPSLTPSAWAEEAGGEQAASFVQCPLIDSDIPGSQVMKVDYSYKLRAKSNLAYLDIVGLAEVIEEKILESVMGDICPELEGIAAATEPKEVIYGLCGDSTGNCVNVRGAMLVKITDTDAARVSELYCLALESIHSLVESSTISDIDGVRSTTWIETDSPNAVCDIEPSAIENVAPTESNVGGSSGLETAAIAGFIVAGVFVILTGLIVGRKLYTSRRYHDTDGEQGTLSRPASDGDLDYDDTMITRSATARTMPRSNTTSSFPQTVDNIFGVDGICGDDSTLGFSEVALSPMRRYPSDDEDLSV